MNEGDVIQIAGLPGYWKVGATEGTRTWLFPCDKLGRLDGFNNAVGKYWIDKI